MAMLVYQRVYKSDWQLPLRILIYWYILYNSEIYKWQQQMTFDRPRFQGSIFRWRILAVKTLWYLWILVSSNILPLLTFISTGWLCWSKTLGAYRLPLPEVRYHVALPLFSRKIKHCTQNTHTIKQNISGYMHVLHWVLQSINIDK